MSGSLPSLRQRIYRVGDKLYDLGTSNKSFLQVAKDLKKLGIKNWFFLLEINDPSLVTIDPYAADEDGHTKLNRDQIARVMNECAKNPWYYLREISRIPDQGGVAVHYKANRGNIAQAYCIWKGYDSWLCLPRQKGKTQSALAMQGWGYNFGTTNSEFIFVNKDGDNSKKNLSRLTEQLDLLPEYFQFQEYISDDGTRVKAKKNATAIRHPVNNNSIITKPKAVSYESALSLARGLTAPILHFDEPEFTPHIKTIVSNSVSTYEQAAANAKRNRAMHARIFTCTPGDLDTKAGIEAQSLLDKTAPWTEKIYDWTDEEVEAYLDARGEDCNRILYIEYQYYKIGLTQAWLRDISAKIGDPLTVRREILLQRLHGSSLSPFPQEDIEFIVESQQLPIDELWLLDYFKFDIYEPLRRNMEYLVGIDCSTGTGGDNNAMTIIDPYSLKPVAEFECSYIGEKKFIMLIMELVRKHIPRCVLCIERNSVGDAIIDFLLDSPIAGNLYFDKAKDLQEEKMRQHETVESMLKKQAQIKTYYGVYTQNESREDMMSILARHVNEYKDKFVTKNIIRDLSRLIRKSNGKIEAGPGFHDDSIMSYLIALYVFYHGNNLPAFGIIKGLKDQDIKNEGMKRTASEIDPSLVDPELIRDVMKREELERQKSFQDILKESIMRNQQSSYERMQAGVSFNQVFQNTPNVVLEDDETSGSIDFRLFDSLNGF